jgi:D-glycero-D-manno-heptose 1,7-bisphosphate phosphatase
MILDLVAHWPVDAAASVMVGDKEIDAQAGRAAGIKGEIVPSGELGSFVDRFLRERRSDSN